MHVPGMDNYVLMIIIISGIQIESETAAAEEKSQETLNKVETLQVSLVGLQKKIGENEYKVTQAETVARNAADLANKASEVRSEI